MNLLIHCINTALMITGIHVACNWPGMIFYTPCRYMERKLPAALAKPTFLCMICMSSVWTLIYSLILHRIGWHIIVQIPAVAGICTLLSNLITIPYGPHQDTGPKQVGL